MRQSCLRTAVTSFPAIPLHEKHQFVFSTLIITDIQYGVICITLIVSYRRSFDHVNPFRCRGAWKASRGVDPSVYLLTDSLCVHTLTLCVAQ